MASIHSFVSDPVVSVKQIPLLIPVEACAFLTVNDHFCLLILIIVRWGTFNMCHFIRLIGLFSPHYCIRIMTENGLSVYAS